MRELTHLRPSLPSKVRWSGNYQMLEKWLKTRLALIDASDHENATIAVDASQGTNIRAKKLNDMLGEIEVTTKYMQTRAIRL